MTGWRKRQVLELALEALETAEIDGNCEYGATEIIRKALAQPQRTWVGLIRGVRVEGDTVVITVKDGNDAARELCGALIEEMSK